ncbi:hypothetical protein C8J57DRAFT_1542294 [Mycena rebaudengoi]|nr:hypothetical protein C8J57DRAFT_1542294 [Mycena rebaudengoi]
MASTQQSSSDNNSGDQYKPYNGPRVPRRTPMACQFCRGRKLKCGKHSERWSAPVYKLLSPEIPLRLYACIRPACQWALKIAPMLF